MIAAPIMRFERNVSYTDDEARLPYALERISGSDRLVVVFPKLAPGQVRPAFGLRRLLGDVHAHRLYFGGDEHFFLGPSASSADCGPRGGMCRRRWTSSTSDERS